MSKKRKFRKVVTHGKGIESTPILCIFFIVYWVLSMLYGYKIGGNTLAAITLFSPFVLFLLISFFLLFYQRKVYYEEV